MVDRVSDVPADQPMTVRCYHPESGNVLTGQVTQWTGHEPERSFRLIPDGLLESVVIREGVWVVTVLDAT